MDNKTGSIIYNISISLKGNVKAAKEMVAVYVADGKAAVIGREDLVGEALHAICVYTGDDNAHEHFVPVSVPDPILESRISYFSRSGDNEFFTTEKERRTGRLCFSGKDPSGARVIIKKGDESIMAWIYVSDDGDVSDAEESLLRGSYSLKTHVGEMSLIFPTPHTKKRARVDLEIKPGTGKQNSDSRKNTYHKQDNSLAADKRRNTRNTTKNRNSDKRDANIPVLIMDDEMLSLDKPGSLRLGAMASGLRDSFQDIGNDSGKAQDFEFMQDFCDFVFTHGIIQRYQRELGDRINASYTLEGSADESWMEHLRSMSQAAALIEGRNYVLPVDVDFAAASVSAAHISVTPMAIAQGYTLFSEIKKITESIADPDEKEKN